MEQNPVTIVPNKTLNEKVPNAMLYFRRVATADTNSALVKGASNGRVYTVLATNVAAGARFVKLYDKATAPTVGTDAPAFTLEVPAGQSVKFDWDKGRYFALGIGIGMTNLGPDADTTALTAGDVILQIEYV